MQKEKMVYACPYNDDSGMHNAYITKNRIEMREDAGRVEELTVAEHIRFPYPDNWCGVA